MSAWKSMDSAPSFTLILLGIWVTNNVTNKQTWEMYVAEYIEDLGCVVDQDGGELPWQWEDFEKWSELPEPPLTTHQKERAE